MMQPMTPTSILEAEHPVAHRDVDPERARLIHMAEHDLHAEACAVLEISPDPQNSFEIAVVLSTLGYTDDSATGFGCRDLFDMAERIYEVVELYFRHPIDDTPTESLHQRMRRNMRYLLRGFSYVELWVLSLALIWVNKSSFWSGGTLTVRQATAISLALVCASLLTGPVVQSFTRRYLFYTLQDNAPLARWVTSRVLYGGAALVFTAIVACWFLLEHVLGAFTPDTNRVFLSFALLLAALQLGFAPLVASRSAIVLCAAVMSGAAVLIWLRPDGWVGQVDISNLFTVQAFAIATVFVVAWSASFRVRKRHERDRPGQPRRALPPRAVGFGIGVAPYALYGALLFAFVFAPKLLAGGMLDGTYTYGPVYEGATDLSMLVLIPALIAVTVMTERFSDDLAAALGELTITEVDAFRGRVLRLVARRFGMLVVVVAVSAAAMTVAVHRLPWLLPARAPSWLFTVGLVAYSLLALTLFCAQLLFVLCRPAAALATMGSGMLVFAAVGVPLVLSGRVMAGPLVGFLAGSAFAALLAILFMVRTARRADWAVYSAM
jgi:hypothetical protein